MKVNKTILFSILILTLCSPCFAQTNTTETLTITTYYPSPYGVYRNLRLNPSNEPTTNVDRGLMYYDNGTDELKYWAGSLKQWVNLTGGGGGSWNTYRGNNIVNNNAGNVGIGLDASSEATQPQSLLTVMKQYNPAAGSGFHRVVSFGQHNIDTNRQSYLSFYFQPEDDGTYAAETVNIFAPGSVGQPCYSKHILITAQDPAGTIAFGIGHRNDATAEVMRLVNTPSGRFVGIGTTTPTQKLEVNGTMRLTPSADPAAAVIPEGSMYYDNARHVLRYRDATQWNNLISESGFITILSGGTTGRADFDRTYNTPPLVIASVVRAPGGTDHTLWVNVIELTNTYVLFDVDSRDVSDVLKETVGENVEVHYIVIPR